MTIDAPKVVAAIEAAIIWHDLALGPAITDIEKFGGRAFPRRQLIEALGELDAYLKPNA